MLPCTIRVRTSLELSQSVPLRNEDKSAAPLGTRNGTMHFIALLKQHDGLSADVEGDLKGGDGKPAVADIVIRPEDTLRDAVDATVRVSLD